MKPINAWTAGTFTRGIMFALALGGMGQIGYGLFQAGLQPLSLYDYFVDHRTQTVVLAAGGSLLILFALFSVHRRTRLLGWSWQRGVNSGLTVTLGLFFCGLAGAAYVKQLRSSKPVVETDFADAAKAQRLKNAPITKTTPSAVNADWSQWRGPERDGVSAETGLRTVWPKEGPRIAWRQPIHAGYSSIAIANGLLYTMDLHDRQERIICLDAATGREVWTHAYPVDYSGIEFGNGPRATPTVLDGRVYALGGTGMLTCLEAKPADGKPRVFWQHDLMAEFTLDPKRRPSCGYASSPLVEGDLVIVHTGGVDACVVAFDRNTGQLRWKALSDNAGYSSPVAASIGGLRQIVCLTGEGIAGLEATTGRELWYFPWVTQFYYNIVTPIVAGNHVFISSYNKGCVLLEITADKMGTFRAEPVYVKANKVMRNYHASSVLHDGFLYGFDVDTAVHKFKCIDLATAEEKWMSRALPSKGCLIGADGHLIILTEKGLLVVVEATSTEFRERGRYPIFDSQQVWALPALSHGRLYVRDAKEIVCIDLKK